MAQTQDEDRIFGNAYLTYEAAILAAVQMVEEIQANTDWILKPLVEDVDLIETQPTPIIEGK